MSTKIKKERIVVICPGRGTYTKETLGYLKKYRPKFNYFLDAMDEKRKSHGAMTISELDNEPAFKPSLHTKGENASSLIYTCSYLDFLNLDFEKYEVVAVTGNSMGWYIALAVAQALSIDHAFKVIDTMGSMMKDGVVGGQIIYPVINDQWIIQSDILARVQTEIAAVNQSEDCRAYISIFLGGYIVIGGNQKALEKLLKKLPPSENYPFQLINHAAFHTPLLHDTSEKALKILPVELFQKPKIPLIDGRGFIWQDYATDLNKLHNYTFNHQVVKPYDFTQAVSVALKEFNPDRLVLLGPGNTLGGAIGQILIQNQWRNLKSKTDFTHLQKENPFLISVGRV